MFAILLPLLCTLIALVLVGGYFFSGKMQRTDEVKLKAGSVGTLKQTKTSSTQVASSAPSSTPGQEWNHLINSVTHCHGDYAYAGTNGSDYVSICITSEGLLYQGYVSNGILRRTAEHVAPGIYEVKAGTHTIRINSSTVEVLDEFGERELDVKMAKWRNR